MWLLCVFGLAMKITVTAKSTGDGQKKVPLNSLYSSSVRHTDDHRPVEPEPPRSEWRYDNETYWPGQLCQGVGLRQSPINIRTETVVTDVDREFIKYGRLKLHGYQSVLVSAVNNGRTIQFTMEGDEAMHPTLTGGPLHYLYRLEQLHFHWISEHAVDGYKYPMEIHFVHIRADLSTTEALRKHDGIAILTVFGNIKSELENDDSFMASEMLEEVVRQLPQLSEHGDRVSGIVMNMSKILTSSQQSYVAYSGSLTSPECNEVVTWIILDNPVFLTYGQICWRLLTSNQQSYVAYSGSLTSPECNEEVTWIILDNPVFLTYGHVIIYLLEAFDIKPVAYKEFWNLAKTRHNFRSLQGSNVTVYRPAIRYPKPMLFSVFANMYDVVANFFSSMNKMISNSVTPKLQYGTGTLI